MVRRLTFPLALTAATLLGGCVTTAPKSDAPQATGSAGGATAVGADARLQTCAEPVGTVRLYDGMTQTARPGPGTAAPPPGSDGLFALANVLQSMSLSRGQGGGGGGGENVSLESLRLLIQQSNCFLIVDRGAAELAANDEKARARNGNEMRDDSNMGPGQEVAADFVLGSTVLRLDNTGSSGAKGGGIFGGILGGVGIGRSNSEAQVQLVVSDLRSKVQVAVSQGLANASDTSLALGVLGKAGMLFGGGTASTEQKTSSSTLLMQAFADAYNKLVPALTNYKTQVVRGGAGTGGTLRVQGAPASPSGTVAKP